MRGLIKLQQERLELFEQGLAPSIGTTTEILRALGVGVSRHTRIRRTRAGTRVICKEHWGPADLIAMDKVLQTGGHSSKIRTHALRCLLEGKDLPEKVHDTVAVYTEQLMTKASR